MPLNNVNPNIPNMPPASSPGFVKGTPTWVQPYITKASQKNNIPTMMLSALLKQESGFNPNARSPVGATGIAQFMPGTAKGMGVNPLDPESSINGAAQYLRNSWDKFGKPELALAAYNAGGGAVQQYGGIPPYKETQNYVKNVMAMAGEPHESANGPLLSVLNDAKQATTLPQQIGSVLSMNPQQAGQYRQQVNQTVPHLPVPQVQPLPAMLPTPNLGSGYGRFMQGMSNLQPGAQNIPNATINAIPNAVAGMARLPAARGLGQGLGDVADIAAGAIQGGGLLDLAKSGLSSLNQNPGWLANQRGGALIPGNDPSAYNTGIDTMQRQLTNQPPSQGQLFNSPEVQDALQQFKQANPQFGNFLDTQVAQAQQTGNFRGILSQIIPYMNPNSGLAASLKAYLVNGADTAGGTIPNANQILNGLQGGR